MVMFTEELNITKLFLGKYSTRHIFSHPISHIQPIHTKSDHLPYATIPIEFDYLNKLEPSINQSSAIEISNNSSELWP